MRASDNRTTSETYPRFKDRKVLREGAGEPYKMEAEVRAMDPYASAEESTMQVLLMPAESLHWNHGEHETAIGPAGSGKRAFGVGGCGIGRDGRACGLTGRWRTACRSGGDLRHSAVHALPGASARLVFVDELSAVEAPSNSETMFSRGRSSCAPVFACSPRPSACPFGQWRVHDFVWVDGGGVTPGGAA
ncbi:hypothetical protein GCM10010342_47030 [Streptomyces anulatus]|nr:hypothetical protein GCM10010342_47030 [Streptomyces anulatus]